MKRSVLTGDNIDGIGADLSKRLTALGFEVHHCSNIYSKLESECERLSPDGLLFFIYRESRELYSFVERVTEKYPDTELIVLSYFRSPSVKMALYRLGVRHFIVMPAMIGEISCYIYEVLVPKEDRIFLTDVIAFVESKGMKRYTQGFLYLCLAIEHCIAKPELLSDITGGLYHGIAEKMNTTPANVERALRHFSDMAASKNVTFEDFTGTYPMTNSELISAAMKEFQKKYPQHR